MFNIKIFWCWLQIIKSLFLGKHINSKRFSRLQIKLVILKKRNIVSKCSYKAATERAEASCAVTGRYFIKQNCIFYWAETSLQSDRGIPDGHDTSLLSSTEQYQSDPLGSSSSQHRTSSSTNSQGKSRKPTDPSSSVFISNSEEDTGENKYKRRPALEWFNRWLRLVNCTFFFYSCRLMM